MQGEPPGFRYVICRRKTGASIHDVCACDEGEEWPDGGGKIDMVLQESRDW